MTVKEMIKKLEQYDENMEVQFADSEYGNREVNYIGEDDGQIIIQEIDYDALLENGR